jgi:MarR family transcriptional regulator, organic hydroperoxide resistance regulator
MRKGREAIPEVIDNLRRVFQAINGYSKNAERTTGLTGPQLWAMKLLASSSSIKVSELARRMFLHPATVVGIIDRLEIKDLVTRTRSKEDRRVVHIELTGLGQELIANAPEVAQVMLVNGLDELSDEQFSHVEEGMQQLVRILGPEQITPQPTARLSKGKFTSD